MNIVIAKAAKLAKNLLHICPTVAFHQAWHILKYERVGLLLSNGLENRKEDPAALIAFYPVLEASAASL